MPHLVLERRLQPGDLRDDRVRELDALRECGDKVCWKLAEEDVLYDRTSDGDTEAL